VWSPVPWTPLGTGLLFILGGIVTADTDTASANGHGKPPEDDWRTLFDAPDFTALVKPAQTVKAKEYATKVKSVLKSGLVGAINVGDFPDAAAILQYGAPFADAAGQLADSNEIAGKAIDIITSPGNPLMLFLMTAIPFGAQLFRNHEEQIKQIPMTRRQARLRRKAMATAKKAEPPRFTIRAFGRAWPIHFRTPRLGKVLAGFKAQTRDPDQMTYQVFTDPAVLRALKKQGIVLVKSEGDNTNAPTG
jgi:hypothetical protein